MACRNNDALFDQITMLNPEPISETLQIPSSQSKLMRYFYNLPVIGTLGYNIAFSKRMLEERFLKEYGREPSIGEMAQRLEVSKEQLAQAVNASLPTVSLTPVSDEEGGKEFDIPQESCEEHLTDLLSLKSVMSSLEKEERMLLYWRFFQNKTQSETAVKLGTTQVQVSRKERKLIEKMRRMMLEDV